MKEFLITKNFDETIIYNPARNFDNLKIITAFTDCERISTHMIKLIDGINAKEFKNKLSVEIILGMAKSSLSEKKHNNICRLIKQLNNPKLSISCRYIDENKEVHSKIYIWCNKNNAEIAFCGSLNYTINAFYKRRESLATCNALATLNYWNELYKDTKDCLDEQIYNILKKSSRTDIQKTKEEEIDSDDEDYDFYNSKIPLDDLKISLLKADGSETGYGSGINWGIRQNGTKRNPNQAYIPYNRNDKKEGFFPDRINPNDKNCPIFRVITKDYGSFHMRMAQANNKALHSAENNAILGEWIRLKLGVPQGCYVSKQMLLNYGKTFVTFRKYSNNVYLLDF